MREGEPDFRTAGCWELGKKHCPVAKRDEALRDLIYSLSSPEHIERLVNQVSEAKTKAEPYLKDTTHFPSVYTSIMTKASRLETVAALWHATASSPDRGYSPKKFSIADWFSTDQEAGNGRVAKWYVF